ncbi:hypothetical protein IJI89_00825 [Candidatus Saccharibacteria bacterium]|nr:hypothetical protein [Candidatus Saccharibacteria bacterium]
MKKVILKCKLQSRDTFEDKLSDIGLDFSAMYWQHDRVYVPRGYQRGMNYPRIIMRTEMDAVNAPARYSMILRRHIEDSGVDITEVTPIIDYTTMVNIILQLGFRQAGEVSRRRQHLIMGEGTKIFLDEIDGRPGEYFAKIESDLGENESVAEARNDLRKTFETLGEYNIVELPYFEM